MRSLQFTLICDGTSDHVLKPILERLIQSLATSAIRFAIDAPPPCPGTLLERIRTALKFVPCDAMFIHRDAEAQDRDKRLEEIDEALSALGSEPLPAHVPVIPVRMTEAWLLLDERAIRFAANNPNGRIALGLPRPRDVESIPDPKARLHELLRLASGLSGRRRHDFKPHRAVHNIAERLENLAPLRQLEAFQKLESDVARLLTALREG
jgi:hypothetical protein